MKDYPNIILLTIDALRPDFIDCYNDCGLTPALKKFAKNSIVFENTFTQGPLTPLSFPAIFTGMYPRKVMDGFGKINKNFPTFAQILKEKGYETCGICSNHFLVKGTGFEKGFNIFYDANDFMKVGGLLYRWIYPAAFPNADTVNEKAIKMLKKIKRPFFLWVHYMDTHGPYFTGIKFNPVHKFHNEFLWIKATRRPKSVTKKEKRKLKTLYKKAIQYIDQKLHELFKVFEDMNLFENSIIIITSDHGEEFAEHGEFSHSRKLYDELLRVPLIIYSPKSKHVRIKKIMGLIDLLPTVFKIAKIETDINFEGKDILNFERKYVISEANPDKKKNFIAIRTENWKYIFDEEKNKEELYDIRRDPLEKKNLVEKVSKQILYEFRNILKEFTESCPKTGNTADRYFDDKIKKHLEFLGYIDEVK